MMDNYSLKVEGLAELERKMQELGAKVSRNALRSATGVGARIIRKQAAKNAPVETGTLKRAVYAKQIREESNQFQQTFYVGVKSGKKYKEKRQDAYYWRFIEFGTRNLTAKPFLRPAFEEKKNEAIESIKEKLADYIEKAAK